MKEIKLEPEHAKGFEKMLSCKAACKALIEETAQHWEENFHIERALWQAVKEHYNLPAHGEFHYDIFSKSIKVHDTMESRAFKPFFRANEYVRGLFKKDKS